MKRLSLFLALLAAPAQAQLIPPDRVASTLRMGDWTLRTNRERWGGVCEYSASADTGLVLSLVTYRDDREVRALRNALFLSGTGDLPEAWEGEPVAVTVGEDAPVEGQVAFVNGRVAGFGLYGIHDEAFIDRLGRQPAMVLRDPAGTLHRFSLDGFGAGIMAWNWCVNQLTYDDPGPAPGR